MSTYFCPGHVTCFFQPVRAEGILSTGSRGAGIRLSLGASVTLDERTDSRVTVSMDGAEAAAPVTRRLLSDACPGRGFDVTVENGLPVGQGFGMSAAGAVALAFCLAELLGHDGDWAFRQAHAAEVLEGGGLGDVAAIRCPGHCPVRISPGIDGDVRSFGSMPVLSLAVLGGEMGTSSVINDPVASSRISVCGAEAVDAYLGHPSPEALFSLSRGFSRSAGLETEAVASVLDALPGHGGMCMLGHSVFSDLPASELEEAAGVPAFTCSSTDMPVTRTG